MRLEESMRKGSSVKAADLDCVSNSVVIVLSDTIESDGFEGCSVGHIVSALYLRLRLAPSCV